MIPIHFLTLKCDHGSKVNVKKKFCINSGRDACNIMSLDLKENSTLYRAKRVSNSEQEILPLAIILSYYTGFIYCKLGHTFLSFSSCYFCMFDNFYYRWLFRDHVKRSFQITNTPEKKLLLTTKI